MFKRALLLVCSLSCAAITAGSVAVVGEFDEEARRNPAFVALYSMHIYGFATATFAAANFALPTYRLLPEHSYTVSNQRVVSLIYHALGVWLFRKILLVAFWNRAGNRTSFFNGKKSGIDRMIKNQKLSEFGHLGSMLVLLSASGYFNAGLSENSESTRRRIPQAAPVPNLAIQPKGRRAHRPCGRFGFHASGVNNAMLDGSVRFLNEETDLKTLYALDTRDAGDGVDIGGL